MRPKKEMMREKNKGERNEEEGKKKEEKHPLRSASFFDDRQRRNVSQWYRDFDTDGAYVRMYLQDVNS